ncbi:NRDE-2, necessary for RNA interference domain-containing protein [Trichoderma austrokoningii]
MASRDGQDAQLSVPKFSSFKSKEPSKEDSQKLDRHHELRRKRHNRDDERSSSRRADEDRGSRRSGTESRRHRDRDRDRRRSQSRERTADRIEKPKPAPKLEGVPGLFMIDTKGDPLIIKYGGIDKSQIPAYWRHGGGRVLGTVGRLVIHRDGPRNQFSLRMPGEGFSTFGRDGLRSKLPKVASRPIRAVTTRNATVDAKDEADGYIPLSSSRKRKRDQVDNPSSDDEQPSYRSIEGKAKPRQYSDSDSDEDSDMSTDMLATEKNNPLKQKSIRLSKQVKDSPDDIDAWLELVDHQDDLLRAGEDFDHTILENEAHSFAKIKVSMLESALENVKNAEDRRRVLVLLMREGVKVWTSKAAAKKWSEVLKDRDDDFLLWKTHLDFLTSNIATFQYEDIKKVLLDRLRFALSRLTSDQPEEAIGEAVFVFLRATRFVHDAGYKELAVAAWQGLLELNFFRPLSTEDEQSSLELFNDFWESEVPRIGDTGAKGFRHYIETNGTGEAADPVKASSIGSSSSRDVYKAWAYLEQSRSQEASMPARTMDDGTDDDPFRVVMYSDISPFLFLIPTSILPAVLSQLIDAFLLFTGFPPAFRASNWAEAAYEDQFISSSLVKFDLEPVKHDDDPDNWQKIEPRFDMGVKAAASPSLLFSGLKWYQYITTKSQNPIVAPVWVSEALKQLVHSGGIEELAQYYLAVAFSLEPAGIKKPAKALLKQYPANSELYNAYALCEFANDPNVASKVLRAAIESPSLSENWYKFLFYRTWTWIEFEQGNIDLAKTRLYSSVDDTLRVTGTGVPEVGSTTLLKARQTFTSDFHQYLTGGDSAGASTLAECIILLSYLTASGNEEPTSASQGNIAAAMNTVDVISRDFQSQDQVGAKAHERVFQFAAHLLYLHASKGPFRRVYLREKFSTFIRQFPQNTVFISMFEWADASLRVIDETRDLLYDRILVKEHDCISSRMFAIQHELAHGNTNTTKAAFEHALTSDICQNSSALWISYIRFCHSQKQLRAKTKDVFYRALRNCPGSKEVIMEAFLTLIRDMESDELKAVYNTMTSKGMRIHVDMEEFLDKRRSEASKEKRR